mgnify:CR=1 FL=1
MRHPLHNDAFFAFGLMIISIALVIVEVIGVSSFPIIVEECLGSRPLRK